MEEKIIGGKKRGMLMLLVIIAVFVLSVALIVVGAAADSIAPAVVGFVVMLADFVLMPGLKILKPQEALVLTLFGKYAGTLKGEGFYYVNPFCSAVNPAAKTKLNQSGDVKQAVLDAAKGGSAEAALKRIGIHTMGDLARLSLENEEVFFREFGVDAEILIDHAWGIESCGMEQIKAYKPSTKSLANGQVLPRAYSWEEGRLAVKEMTEQVVLGLVEQGYVAEGVTLYVGYQILSRESASAYHGPLKVNYYGRKVPPSVHGTGKLGAPTASLSRITQAVLQLYDRLVDKELQVRRMSIAAIRLCRKEEVAPQLSFYADQQDDGRETALLEATIGLHRRYGKNAVVKGMDLLEAGTTRERNNQIGGHRK